MIKFLKIASLSILCFLISFSSVVAASAIESVLDVEYMNLVSSQRVQRSRSSTLSENNLEELRRQNVDEDFYLFFESFSGTNFIDYISTDIGSVVINEDTDTPILIDGSINNQLRILINSEEYIVTKEDNLYGSNILLENKAGKHMFLHEETYDIIDLMTNENNPLVNSRAGAYWLPEGGGSKGKTGTWLVVLALALDAAGWVGKFNHPVVGIVLKVVGSAVTIGSLFYVTLYTIVYQAQRSDCRSYIKQRKVFYNHSNYTEYLKTQYTYFHSVRPDYAGGACMGY